MATETKERVNPNPTLVVGVSNTSDPVILDTSRISKEPFELQGYKTVGTNKKGQENKSVDLAYHEGVVSDLLDAGNVMELAGQGIEYKIIHLRKKELGREKQSFVVYDNVLKKAVVGYSKFEDEEKFTEDKDLVQNGEVVLKASSVKEEELIAAYNVLLSLLSDLKQKDKVAYSNIINQLKKGIGNEEGKVVVNGHNIFDFVQIVDENLERSEEILSKYKELRSELLDEKDIKLPKADEFSARGSFSKRYNPVAVKGIRGINNVRNLLKTIDDIDMENFDEASRRYIEQMFAWKEEAELRGSIANLNTTSIGFDQNGNVVVVEDRALRSASNGEIYKDMGFAEITKPIRSAIGSLEKMYLDENAEIPNQVAEAARDKLSEKAFELVKRYEGEIGDALTKELSSLFENLSVEDLKAKKREAIDALNRIQTFVMDNMMLQFREENAKKLVGKILRKDEGGMLNNYYASKFKEGGFVRKGDEEERYKAILINAKLPTLSTFGDDLFEKSLTASVVKIYVDENGKLLDVQAGANISQHLKTYGKLANVLNGIANLNEESENLDKLAKQYANYGKSFGGKSSTGYGILGVFDALENGGAKTKALEKVLKPALEEIRDLLLKEPLAAAKKVRDIKEGKVEGRTYEVLGRFLKNSEKATRRNASLVGAYFAAKSGLVREAIIEYYNAEDKKTVYQEFTKKLKEDKKLPKEAKKALKKNFMKFNVVLYRELSALEEGKNAFNQKVKEKNTLENEEVKERTESYFIQNVSRFISKSVLSTKAGRSFGFSEGQVYITNSWGQKYRNATDGINNEELVEYKTVKMGDEERTLPSLNKERFYSLLQERRAVVDEVVKKINESIKEQVENSQKERAERKVSLVGGVGIGESVSLEDVVLDDEETKEAAIEMDKESVEQAIEESLSALEIPLEEEGVEDVAKEEDADIADDVTVDIGSAFKKAKTSTMKM